MIWGKTYSQKYELEQQRRASLYKKWKKYYAWCPTKLRDGRWVWFRHFYRQHRVVHVMQYWYDHGMSEGYEFPE